MIAFNFFSNIRSENMAVANAFNPEKAAKQVPEGTLMFFHLLKKTLMDQKELTPEG